MNAFSNEVSRESLGFSVSKEGGKDDGEIFSAVRVTFEDGTQLNTFVSSERAGYFDHVFVPHGFDQPEIIR